MRAFNQMLYVAVRSAIQLGVLTLTLLALAGQPFGATRMESRGDAWLGLPGGLSALLVLTAALIVISSRASRPTGATIRSAEPRARRTIQPLPARTDSF